MYCGHEHLRLSGEYYICDNCDILFRVTVVDEDTLTRCIECGEDFECDRDLQICDICSEDFDLDKLWKDHDENKIDALDFNESSIIRDKYRRKDE